MIQQFVIPGRLDGLNEYTKACRAHNKAGHRMKKDNQEIVEWCIKGAHLKPYEGAVRIHYAFYEKPAEKNGAMRDKSNIAAFAVKVIEDALQEQKIIKNDNWKYMAGFSCDFYRASSDPRIVVTIEEA